MLRYNRLQAEVISILWSTREASFTESIRPLMGLSSSEKFAPNYPGIIRSPSQNNRCPYCRTSVEKLKSPYIAMHLLECHCESFGYAFCISCAQTIPKDEELAHLRSCRNRKDYERSTLFNGVIVWRGLVIAEGRCPFPDRCSKIRWRRQEDLQRHIEDHLSAMTEGEVQCPHERCRKPCDSIRGLRIHFGEIHRLKYWKRM